MSVPEKTYPAVRLEIKPSKILPNEIGVFATRQIAKDAVIVPATHFSDVRLIKWSVFDRLDATTKRKIMGYCPGTAEGFFAPPDLNYISVAWQINHSCEPNVGFNSNDDFVAIRTIRRGDELSWDYAFAETNPKFRMRCRCGSALCRGIVKGTDWQMLVTDGDCGKYFSTGLRQFIETVWQAPPPPRDQHAQSIGAIPGQGGR